MNRLDERLAPLDGIAAVILWGSQMRSHAQGVTLTRTPNARSTLAMPRSTRHRSANVVAPRGVRVMCRSGANSSEPTCVFCRGVLYGVAHLRRVAERHIWRRGGGTSSR
jgi:hypothetical protein